jgi:histidinol-phosphatase (PHP family)
MLPPDRHVHTEWSWDAPAGSMEQACARAMTLGLRSVAFTDHADFTAWATDLPGGDPLPARLSPWVSEHVFLPPPLDIDGYRQSVERCRALFPELRILFGVELSEPHWHPREAAALLDRGGFDLVVGGMHSLIEDGRYLQVVDGYLGRTPEQVVRDYLGHVVEMIETSDRFDVLAHIDYPIRKWPAGRAPVAPAVFEGEYRAVLRALAGSGRALEINTRLPLDRTIIKWWHEEDGAAVCFGSDAHDPLALAHGFSEAAAVAEAVGFRAGAHRHDFWLRG